MSLYSSGWRSQCFPVQRKWAFYHVPPLALRYRAFLKYWLCKTNPGNVTKSMVPSYSRSIWSILGVSLHFKDSPNHSALYEDQSDKYQVANPALIFTSLRCLISIFQLIWTCPECTQIWPVPFYFFFSEGTPWFIEDYFRRTRALASNNLLKYKPWRQPLFWPQTDEWPCSHMSLVLAPRARSPSVEKKSSISFSSSRLRFSASSRARSEFRSLISSMRCFFFSCSISCSRRSIWAQRAALDSSSLRGAAKHRLYNKDTAKILETVVSFSGCRTKHKSCTRLVYIYIKIYIYPSYCRLYHRREGNH